MAEQVTRGDLPHWYRPGYAHFVTYRLAGSLPQSVLRELRLERDRRLQGKVPTGLTREAHRHNVHKLMFAKYDAALDAADSVCWLANEAVAAVVRENLYHHHGSKYELLAYTIMPNHVHVVLQPFESALQRAVADAASVGRFSDAGSVGHGGEFETPDRRSVLSRIMHSLKSYTANRANELLGRTGAFWQKESYDHWVRDIEEVERIIAYVAANPVRAGLCSEPQQWRFSSACDRFQQDGSDCALVGSLRDDWRR